MLRRLAGWIIVLAFSAWAIVVFVRSSGSLPPLRLGVPEVFGYLLMAALVVVLNAALVNVVARRTGRGITAKEWIGLGFVSTLMNYFLPLKAGMGLRLTYYMRCAEHDVWRLSAALTAATLLSQSVSVALLLFALAHTGLLPIEIIMVAIVAISALGLALIVASREPLATARGKLGYAINKVRAGFGVVLLSGRTTAVIIVALSLAVMLLTALRLLLGFGMLGQSYDFMAALVLATAVSVSGLISVSVGGWGIREASIVIAGRYIGMPQEACLLLALLDRVFVSLIVAAVAIPWMRQIQSQLVKRPNRDNS